MARHVQEWEAAGKIPAGVTRQGHSIGPRRSWQDAPFADPTPSVTLRRLHTAITSGAGFALGTAVFDRRIPDPLGPSGIMDRPDAEYPVRALVFAASLRSGSLNDRLASLAATVVEQNGGTVDRARLAEFDCPSYGGDLEGEEGIPTGAREFRRRLLAADAFIIASPEYNGSMPGVLKNVIDWASRFRPQPLRRKHGLLMSASPSMAGGNRGLWALRVPLEHLGADVYPDMFSLARAHEMFDPEGRITDAKLQEWFEGTVECFLRLVEAAKHYPVMKTQWVEFLGEKPDAATERVETATHPA
jgi:chromate reductase, NAD(P)H dehydrogenase (quinone)